MSFLSSALLCLFVFMVGHGELHATPQTVKANSSSLTGFPKNAFLTHLQVPTPSSHATISPTQGKGFSFSLPANTQLTGFVIHISALTHSGSVRGQLSRGLKDLPWLAPELVFDFILPAKLPKNAGLLQVDFPTPLTLPRGTWTITLQGISATFDLTTAPHNPFPSGCLITKDPSTHDRWMAASPSGSDAIFALLGSPATPPSPPTHKPNIIFILADDLGWTDLQTGKVGPNVINGVNYGSNFYQTPNLARLAAQGLSFTHCFVQPNCSPTRAAIFSGQYPSRSGNGVFNVASLNRGTGTPSLIAPKQRQEVPAAHTTLAEAFSQAGYVTAHFGKFHIGGYEGGATTLPLNAGFEFNFGGNAHGSPSSYHASDRHFGHTIGPELDRWANPYDQAYVHSVLMGTKAAQAPLHQRASTPNDPLTLLPSPKNPNATSKFLTDAMGDAALDFIDDHLQGELKNLPFYLQFHFYAVHTPTQSRADLLTKYQNLKPTTHHHDATYAGLVENLDQTLGRLLDHLQDPNGDGNPDDSIATKTLIVFCSDNGGFTPTNNAPLRGLKGSFFNGGLRVPLIISQPGTIPSSTTSDTLIHAVDFMPTLLQHAGLSLPNHITYDGISFADHLLSPTAKPRARSPIFYHFPGYLDHRARPLDAAVGRFNGKTYKLIYHYDPTYTGGNVADGLQALSSPWELYNIDDDLGETHNLLSPEHHITPLHRDIANQLAAQLHQWLHQASPDWLAPQPISRATRQAVPFLPAIFSPN